MKKSDSDLNPIQRRETLLLGVSVGIAAFAGCAKALALGAAGSTPSFAKDTETESLKPFEAIHGGKGTIRYKLFAFDGNPSPAGFLVYDIPPGASEGVHVHHLDDRNMQGPYDEYYYVISGRGTMNIDGQNVPVAAGDHVHTPLDVSHGIENTDETQHLRVFLTFIKREAIADPAGKASAAGLTHK